MLSKCGVALSGLLAIAVVASADVLPAARAEPAAPSAQSSSTDVMFGHQTLGAGIDRETISVGSDLGKFKRIRLHVAGHDIHVVALSIAFADGGHLDVPVEADLKVGTPSPWFDVDPEKFIRTIQLTYQSQPGTAGQARVEVTGEYAKDWLAADGEGKNYHQGWLLLGAQTAGFTSFDRDVINIGDNQGGFARLRIEAVDRAITLKEIRVKFAAGPDEVFTMRRRVDPGKPYGPIEFKSGSAPIRAIVAVYRSRFDFGKGLKSALNGKPAVVQIWGQH